MLYFFGFILKFAFVMFCALLTTHFGRFILICGAINILLAPYRDAPQPPSELSKMTYDGDIVYKDPKWK